MLVCKIQWIDSQGTPTPDENIAVGFATSTIEYPDGSRNVRTFPICACHKQRADRMLLWHRDAGASGLYKSTWTFEPIALSCEAL